MTAEIFEVGCAFAVFVPHHNRKTGNFIIAMQKYGLTAPRQNFRPDAVHGALVDADHPKVRAFGLVSADANARCVHCLKFTPAPFGIAN